MKVDKQKFLDAVEYIRQVNKCELQDLDLSEFFDKDFQFKEEISHFSPLGSTTSVAILNSRIEYRTMEQAIDHWRMVGLDNRDFILTYYEGE